MTWSMAETQWWKTELKQLNNTEFERVTDKVKDIRAKLQNIREIMTDLTRVAPNTQSEKELQVQLEKRSMTEESAMWQKSRL